MHDITHVNFYTILFKQVDGNVSLCTQEARKSDALSLETTSECLQICKCLTYGSNGPHAVAPTINNSRQKMSFGATF